MLREFILPLLLDRGAGYFMDGVRVRVGRGSGVATVQYD
jgi:hypothetical protein